MLERLLPEWRELMTELPYSITGVAQAAGMSPSNVQAIMEGGNQNPGIQTIAIIKATIEGLRDTCPTCHRRGLKEALQHGPDRSPAKRGKD